MAQIEFEDRTEDIFIDEIFGVLPICVSDLNGDYLDDIAFSPGGTSLMIAYQLEGGEFHMQDYGPLPDGAGSLWSFIASDINQDGWNELIVGFGQKLYVFNNQLENNQWNFEEVDDQIFCQNLSSADYDADGYVDIFVCNDVGYNRIYSASDQSSDLQLKVNMDQNTDYIAGGNYGSAFSDIDGDCDLDLYLAKCKQGETDPTSPDRINLLYRNDGGILVEETADLGISINSQSWTGTFGDLDNDLDLDLVVTNHSEHNMILLNDGSGVFTEVSPQGFRTTRFSLQSILRDLDNNGYLDIIITGTEHGIFMNNGDMTFTEKDMSEFTSDMLSCAVGDFNADGFIDIYGSSGQVFVLPSNLPDRIYFNKGNDNNFVGFNLRGSDTHINAIGAKVTLYAEGEAKFVREVNSGDSYGIGNSLSVHFGLGDIEVIDSIRIDWSSSNCGTIYHDLDVNQYHLISEDCGLIEVIPHAGPTRRIDLCSGDHILISAPEGPYSYEWNTGDTTRQLLIEEEGFYQATITDVNNSCQSFTQTIFVDLDPELNQNIKVGANGACNFCAGEMVEICLDETRYDVEWNTGETDRCIFADASGDYFAKIIGPCADVYSDTASMVFHEYTKPTSTSMIFDDVNNTLENIADGDNIIWYRDSLGMDSIGEGSRIVLEQIFNDTTVYARTSGPVQGPVQMGGKPDRSGAGGENFPAFPGPLEFNVYKSFHLLSVDVYGFEANTQVDLLIRDRDVNVLLWQEVVLDTGWNTIDLDIYIEPGNNYQMNFQGDPSAYVNRGGVQYPYPIGDGLGEVTSGVFTDTEYFYFYNWKVREYDLECSSELVPFIFLISSNQELEKNSFSLHPNPASSRASLLMSNEMNAELEIYDVTGKRVMSKSELSNGVEIDLSALSAGLYIVQLKDQSGSIQGTSKLIIAE